MTTERNKSSDVDPLHFPIGSRWVLPDGRRVQVTRSPYWLRDHTVTLFVENRRRGGQRETAFRADRLALIAKPLGDAKP